MADKNGEQIVFFDGVCNLCNKSVDFIIRHDHHKRFKFAPIQGKTAKEKLPAEAIAEMNSIIFFDNRRLYYRAEAALMISKYMGAAGGLLARIGLLIPTFISNKVYEMVAANRYKLFGRRETCRVPTAEERARFLD
jgi:predicted DCC family thiol-disulfide oxidoreductase YuxK